MHIMQNLEEYQNLFNIIVKLVTDGPEEFESCSTVFSEISRTSNWIVHHLGLVGVVATIFSNLATHFFKLSTDSFHLIRAFGAHDYYEAGKNSGEMFVILTN